MTSYSPVQPLLVPLGRLSVSVSGLDIYSGKSCKDGVDFKMELRLRTNSGPFNSSYKIGWVS